MIKKRSARILSGGCRGGICGMVVMLLLTAGFERTATAQCDKPGLLIVLDKSSSMVTGIVPSGETKWEAARTAITNITTRFQDSIDFGLVVFPNPNRCSPGSVVVDIGPGTSTQIASYLVTPPPSAGNWTPMSQTLEAISSYPPLSDPSLRRAVVLVSDGWQWCHPYDPATRFDPVEAAATLRRTGATLYVVGFGDSVDALTLNIMAYESATYLPGCNPEQSNPLASDQCYHKADSLETLIQALETVAMQVREEVCDGLDNDCDTIVDDGLLRACSTVCGSGLEGCRNGVWEGCDAPLPTEERCDGALDEDCDGTVDEGCQCTDGDSRQCGLNVGVCSFGVQNCTGGTWGECIGGRGPEEETCDGLDNDCDGALDEGCVCVSGDTRTCGISVGECRPGTQRCIGGAWGGCEGGVEPAPERCNGLDDDCDGVMDEGCVCTEGETRECGTDTGECSAGTQTCRGSTWSTCDGAVWSTQETCDGLDNDCNGVADNGARCPPGQVCLNGNCTDRENLPNPDFDRGEPYLDAEPGCGCLLTGAQVPSSTLFTLLVLFVLIFTFVRRR